MQLAQEIGIAVGGSAAPIVEMNPSSVNSVGTSSTALREYIYSTSTFKEQLASRCIQFDFSKPKRNFSQMEVRTEMSES